MRKIIEQLFVVGWLFKNTYIIIRVYYLKMGEKMGISGVSVSSLVLILVIVLVLFGTKRLKNMGKDLGEAVKGFQKATEEDPALDKKSKE